MENKIFCPACMKEHLSVLQTCLEIGANDKCFIAKYEYCEETDTLIETEVLARENMVRYKAASIDVENSSI